MYISRVSGYTFKKISIFSEGLFALKISVDTDEMLHYASFYLGLHCL